MKAAHPRGSWQRGRSEQSFYEHTVWKFVCSKCEDFIVLSATDERQSRKLAKAQASELGWSFDDLPSCPQCDGAMVANDRQTAQLRQALTTVAERLQGWRDIDRAIFLEDLAHNAGWDDDTDLLVDEMVSWIKECEAR